jgi:uncharacterized protein with ParB-like and HNH nuclease domain
MFREYSTDDETHDQPSTGNADYTDIVNLYEDGLLNLEPGFQRQSVWSERDRAKLIESILRNYPLPAIFLYRREHEGQIIYDVIDGKQRIESILMFMGEMRGLYWAQGPAAWARGV